MRSIYCSFQALWDWFLWQQAPSHNKNASYFQAGSCVPQLLLTDFISSWAPDNSDGLCVVIVWLQQYWIPHIYVKSQKLRKGVICLMQMKVNWYEKIYVYSFSHHLFSSPLLTGQVLERIATEFNQLQFHAVQSKGMPLLDKVRPVSIA